MYVASVTEQNVVRLLDGVNGTLAGTRRDSERIQSKQLACVLANIARRGATLKRRLTFSSREIAVQKSASRWCVMRLCTYGAGSPFLKWTSWSRK